MSNRVPSTIAVVTVTYNSSSTIGSFLESAAASEPLPFPTYVIDNDSADWDSTRSIAEQHGASFTRLVSNVGYGGAINRAVSELPSEVDLILIANPDLTVAPGAIRRLSQVFADSNRVAAVGPQILNPDGTVYPSARRQPDLRIGVGHALLADFWPGNPWSHAYHQDGPSTSVRTREVGWLSGAFLLVDRRKFDEAGGFDEDFFMYFEDVDLGRRFLQHGYTNVYEPAAEVTHLGGHSTGGSAAKMLRAHHDSAYLFMSKRYPGPLFLPLRLALRVGLRARAAWITRRTGR